MAAQKLLLKYATKLMHCWQLILSKTCFISIQFFLKKQKKVLPKIEKKKKEPVNQKI
jgi:hypothetical protein